MIVRRYASVAVLMCSAAAAVSAQSALSPECALQPNAVRDACQKGLDIFAIMAPQVNGAIAGGGAVLGSARAVRGMSIGLRINAVDGRVPDLSAIRLSTTGVVASTIPTKRAPIPAPTLDVAVGLFPGFPLGLQRVLSLEALVNVAYLPNRDLEDFSIKTKKGSLRLGYGGRVGLLSDRFVVPAVAVSFFRRAMPTATFSTTFASNIAGVATQDSINLADLSIETDAYRLSISKKLGFIEIGGGVGQDRYRTTSIIRATVTPSIALPTVTSAVGLSQSVKRNAAYGSFAINISKLRIAAEAGATFADDSVRTYNTFTDGKLNERRLFGSVGLRVGF